MLFYKNKFLEKIVSKFNNIISFIDKTKISKYYGESYSQIRGQYNLNTNNI